MFAHGGWRLAADGRVLATSRSDAFVLTNAFADVMRAMILAEEGTLPPRQQIEDALTRLIVSFADRKV